MSAQIQFGPEWMRKGRGKTSTAIGASTASDATIPPQESVAPLASTGVASSKPASMTTKRHPSLGNLSASGASSGPTHLTPSAPTPSPGAFSFAAAAQAGSAKESNQHGPSSASSSSIMHSTEGESARYSKRLLSLYSSERGGKGTAPGTDSTTVQGSKSNTISSAVTGSSDRESRRSTNTNVDGLGLIRPHTPPNGEPRGLNARTSTLLHEKMAPTQRPGLFQRGSNGPTGVVTNAALSPTSLYQSRDRDRHGTGIQGGVLSGVAAPLGARRRKESEPGFGIDSLRSPRTPLDAEHQWDQRRTNDAFTSARNRSNRTTAPHDATSVDAGAAGGTTAPSVTSNGEVIETYSRLVGRRERAPGEGPIGPPSDHSGGFARFAGYERRRERQVHMPAPKQPLKASERSNREEGHSSTDTDLSKHATYVLDSLRLDDDEEELRQLDEQAASQHHHHQQQQQQQQQQQHQQQLRQQSDWSPETQDWLYRDPSGQVQGPFKANMMQDWYAANYFEGELLVRRVEDETFQTLGEMLAIIGNAESPFLIPPGAYAQRSYENKMNAALEQQPASFIEPHLQQQQQLSSNTLGWPGNLDILNHYGNGSGHSSPFATPQGHFAELNNGSQLRQKTQQEQYNEMMRQRELAEQRAMYEQRAAQMAAMAMAQAQGRDPGSLGMWGAEPMLGGDWNQMINQPQPNFDRSEEMRYHQQQQQQYYEQMGQHHQPVWDAQNHAQGHTQEENAHHAVEQGQVQNEQLSEQQISEQSQETVLEEVAPTQDGDNAIEEAFDPANIPETFNAEEVTEEEAPAIEEEESPEQVWPQSPSAVEFASEPLMSEEQWSKEESPSRGKKSRREKAKQKTDEEIKQERAAPNRSASAINSGNIKTMTEEQFRRSQTGSRQSSTSVQTPLSSWLPDASTGLAAAAAAKSAPWANNAQDSTGLSLREIQEAEARQADARKAARPRLQLNSTPSSDGGALPTTLSWGLASSHSNNNGREAATTPASAVTPAWNARQAPKKTLMEIQEEERKRAQKVKEVQANLSEGKNKGYADSASKMQSPSNNGVASGWSVVGTSGKPSTPTSVLSRPTKLTSPAIQRAVSSSTGASASAAPPGWSSSAPNGPSGKVQAAPKKSAVDGVNAPSAEFLRHCKEQLKGLNVKVDDFIEMLLSFPLDPSPEVVEIIADTVYASSSTLDGRRFAADFVAKRKLDANQVKASSHVNKASVASSVNGPSSTTNARSLSDVLKTTPPSNDGFGGFKVVKAKGAKKR